MAKKTSRTTKARQPDYLPAIRDKEIKAAPPGMASMWVMQVFQNADLRYRLPGLKEVCRKHKMPVSELKIGVCVLFVNRKRDFINLIVGNGSNNPVLASYRFPTGEKLPRKGLEAIATAFRAPKQIDADDRLARVLDEMRRKKAQVEK